MRAGGFPGNPGGLVVSIVKTAGARAPAHQARGRGRRTCTPYRGGNSVYLSVTQTAKGYRDHRWATYKQIHDMGGQVRTGEQATHVLFYKFDDQQEKAGAADTPATSPAGATAGPAPAHARGCRPWTPSR